MLETEMAMAAENSVPPRHISIELLSVAIQNFCQQVFITDNITDPGYALKQEGKIIIIDDPSNDMSYILNNRVFIYFHRMDTMS